MGLYLSAGEEGHAVTMHLLVDNADPAYSVRVAAVCQSDYGRLGAILGCPVPSRRSVLDTAGRLGRRFARTS